MSIAEEGDRRSNKEGTRLTSPLLTKKKRPPEGYRRFRREKKGFSGRDHRTGLLKFITEGRGSSNEWRLLISPQPQSETSAKAVSKWKISPKNRGPSFPPRFLLFHTSKRKKKDLIRQDRMPSCSSGRETLCFMLEKKTSGGTQSRRHLYVVLSAEEKWERLGKRDIRFRRHRERGNSNRKKKRRSGERRRKLPKKATIFLKKEARS